MLKPHESALLSSTWLLSLPPDERMIENLDVFPDNQTVLRHIHRQ
jgi:hypothetical protein